MRRLAVALWVVAAGMPRLVSAQDVIFSDGFESADLSAWDLAATDGGDLAAAAPAAMAGTRTGLAAVVDDISGLYVQDDTPADEPTYRARFHFDPGDFDPGEAAGKLRTRIFIAFEEAPTRRLLALVLRRRLGEYSLMARARRDDNSQANTPFFPLEPGPHAVEIAWRQASAADAADGTLELWIDGVSVAFLEGLQNRLSTVDFVRMGALSVKAGASGTLHWDEFESRRDSYIGPCSAETCLPGCPPGMGDCDAVFADCEASLTTEENCGACGLLCANEHGSTSCLDASCAPLCDPLWRSCDFDAANGCERAVNTLADCGDCDVACSRANATATCSTGTCQIAFCNSLFGNCDGNSANGCERALNTLTNCGNCNVSCNLANASETCGTGTCQINTCNAGFGNCDGIHANGCERSLNTTTHCGGCNVPCSRANANVSCSTGTCTLTSCLFGFANCDGNSVNGCEVSLNSASNSPPGEDLGSWEADTQEFEFPSCESLGCISTLTRTGVGEKHFTITALDGASICTDRLVFRFQLVVPPSVDYDLVLTGTGFSCSPGGCVAAAGTGADELIHAYRVDAAIDDDDFTVGIEVRYFGGTSCQPWTLNVFRRDCL